MRRWPIDGRGEPKESKANRRIIKCECGDRSAKHEITTNALKKIQAATLNVTWRRRDYFSIPCFLQDKLAHSEKLFLHGSTGKLKRCSMPMFLAKCGTLSLGICLKNDGMTDPTLNARKPRSGRRAFFRLMRFLKVLCGCQKCWRSLGLRPSEEVPWPSVNW